MASDPAMNTKVFSHVGLRAVQMMAGAYDSIVDADAQDAMLHSIFSTLVYHHHMALGAAKNEHLSQVELRGVLMTLFRLFCKEEWEAARTYFHQLTGTLLTDAMVAELEEEQDVLKVMDGTLALNPITIVGDCDREDIFLNNLWFDSAAYYDSDSDSDSDSDATSRSSSSRSGSETRTDIEEYVAEVERHMASAPDEEAAKVAPAQATTRRRRRRDTPRASADGEA